MEIILASMSERRSRILTECGIIHKVVPSHTEERTGDSGDVSRVVVENAVKKAESVARDYPGAIVIGADTLVLHGDTVVGKPVDEDEALDMLKRFSGGEIEVYTGLCVRLMSRGKKSSGFEKSGLKVVELSDKEAEKYFRLLAPYDKAGGFSIEGVGSLLFDDIKGSYFNILGLPMEKLSGLFREIGEDIVNYIKM